MRAVGTAGGSWLFALQRRAGSLTAGTGPYDTLPDNGKRVFDRRYGVARDLLREELRLLLHTVPAISQAALPRWQAQGRASRSTSASYSHPFSKIK